MGKMIDTAAAAARLGVNLQRIRALLGARRIPGARLVGRQWFVPEDFKVTPGTRGPSLKRRK
jgi:methylase of polypeptide subunit release factors